LLLLILIIGGPNFIEAETTFISFSLDKFPHHENASFKILARNYQFCAVLMQRKANVNLTEIPNKKSMNSTFHEPFWFSLAQIAGLMSSLEIGAR
jgi:hypothetical protein